MFDFTMKGLLNRLPARQRARCFRADIISSIPRSLFLLLAVPCFAQRPDLQNLPSILKFETEQAGGMPAGWGGGPPNTIFADDKILHGGKWAARIERNSQSAQTFSTITNAIPMD